MVTQPSHMLLVFVIATQKQMIFISVCYGYSTTSDIY